MIFLKLLGTLIRVIRDGATPNQIAGGMTLGMAIGLIPGWPLQVILLLSLLLLINVNLGIGVLFAIAASGVAWVLDTPLNALGALVLSVEGLQGLFTALFNNEFWMLTRFNNTVVMGAVVVMLLLALPLFLLGRIGVVAYRVRFEPWILKLRIVRVIQGSSVFGWYQRIAQLRFW